MFSYIALTWNASDTAGDRGRAAAALQQQLRTLKDFRVVLSVPGLHIVQKTGLGSACDTCALPDNGGAVVGTLFSWPTSDETPRRQLSIAPGEGGEIVESQGQHLVTDFWGRYVAFIRLKQTHRYIVIRDPSGMLPCFRRAHHGVQIWFSCLEDLAPLRLTETTINWRYIERHVASGLMKTHGTGLTGIDQVQAGERCEVEDDQVRRRLIWDPAIVCNTDVLEDARASAEKLRFVTKACVDAWASAYSGILHALSGGLDSSIVAVLLGQAPTKTPVTCVNYFTVEAEGDERSYARSAAGKAGFELIEKQRTPRSVDLRSIRNIAVTPSPWFYNYYIEHAEYEMEQARQHRATAIFTGGGGDGLFCRAEAVHSVADYVHRHGLTSRLPAIALNAARLEGKSFSAALWHAFSDRRRAARRKSAMEHVQQLTLVSAATIEAQRGFLETRFDNPDRHNVPPGKWMQILCTAVPPAFYDQFNNPLAVERVPPLVSQPVMEVCLRIPTYVLVENGWDRAIARRAFLPDLPAAIVNRRGKGGIQNHVRRIFSTNMKFIREIMLDGELARRGILNRSRMETCLSGRQSLTGMEFSEIQQHLSTEAWIDRQGRSKGKVDA